MMVRRRNAIRGCIIVVVITAALSSLSSVALAQDCPNAPFRIGPASSLPDCRAYERASPAEKNGGAVEGFPDLLVTSEDGSRVTYFDQAGTGIPAAGGSAQDFSTYLSSRGGEGWATQRLMPPQVLGEAGDYLGSTPDLRFAFVEATKRGSGADAGHGLYKVDTDGDLITPIVSNAANKFSPELTYSIDGASTDGSRVLFETQAPLLPVAAPNRDNLYLWSESTGQVTLAGILPGGGTPPEGSFGGAYRWFREPETSNGGAQSSLAVQSLHALTDDATQIFFTEAGGGQLYLRSGLAGASPETTDVSRANTGVIDPNGMKPAAFQQATPNGKSAFFTSAGKLTSDANTGEFDEGQDLYRWDSDTQTLTDITPTLGPGPGAQVQGLLGISDDGASGYFSAKGVLANGATEGASNIYRFDGLSDPTISFVATLEEGGPDDKNWSPQGYETSAVFTNNLLKTSRVSSDGSTLLFKSVRSITGYDNKFTSQAIECPEAGCPELFRYQVLQDPSGARLDCVSCDPDGSLPVGGAKLTSNYINGGAALPDGNPLVRFPNNLSANGDRIFFESPDPLVPADTNGASGCPAFGETFPRQLGACQDVYEWEAAGTPEGSCNAPVVNGGCLYLLSTGNSSSPAFFAGASDDGQTAIIVTDSQLVPDDVDAANDAYSVRVGGGLPSQFLQPGGVCGGEDCLGPASGTPESPPSSSATVHGAQNVAHHKRRKRHKRHHGHRHHSKRHSARSSKARSGRKDQK